MEDAMADMGSTVLRAYEAGDVGILGTSPKVDRGEFIVVFNTPGDALQLVSDWMHYGPLEARGLRVTFGSRGAHVTWHLDVDTPAEK